MSSLFFNALDKAMAPKADLQRSLRAGALILPKSSEPVDLVWEIGQYAEQHRAGHPKADQTYLAVLGEVERLQAVEEAARNALEALGDMPVETVVELRSKWAAIEALQEVLA